MKTRTNLIVTVMLSLLSLTACANQKSGIVENGGDASVNTEPVKLRLAVVSTAFCQ
ncbi:hypothetical protein GCM10023310_10670 [Paenibacillus vulneris]|uniref:Uncharacterized protein n=1 Tax=Paenibacillus vulneris TaxID=1133364 RepID=A0ABW3UDM5_9BACL